MARKSVKQRAIEHYDRMIDFARNYKCGNDALFMRMNMIREINEAPNSKNCPYCQISKLDELPLYEGCIKCKLYKGDGIKFNCCDGLYEKMYESKTVKTWIKRAEAVRQYIIDNG